MNDHKQAHYRCAYMYDISIHVCVCIYIYIYTYILHKRVRQLMWRQPVISQGHALPRAIRVLVCTRQEHQYVKRINQPRASISQEHQSAKSIKTPRRVLPRALGRALVSAGRNRAPTPRAPMLHQEHHNGKSITTARASTHATSGTHLQRAGRTRASWTPPPPPSGRERAAG